MYTPKTIIIQCIPTVNDIYGMEKNIPTLMVRMNNSETHGYIYIYIYRGGYVVATRADVELYTTGVTPKFSVFRGYSYGYVDVGGGGCVGR